MSLLLALPDEILIRIAQATAEAADPRDGDKFRFENVKNLRLVCKHFAAIGVTMFETATLYPDEESYRRFNELQNCPELCQRVRHVVLNTSVHAFDEKEREYEDDEEAHPIPAEWYATLGNVGKFPNLTSLILRFRDACADGENDYNYVLEDTDVRERIMQEVLAALNNNDHPCPHFRSFTIKNLQDLNFPDVVKSEDFKTVLGRLTELHLHIATENNSASPENNVGMDTLHEFFRELPTVYLQPVCGNLTHLSLYCDIYWGWCPGFNPRSVYFPKLKYLALGNFVFAHDFQLDWILSHGTTLETLIMDDCAILFYLRPYDSAGDNTSKLLHDNQYVCSTEKSSDYPSTDPYSYAYDARWHQFLSKIEASLPHLTKFAFGHGNWDMGSTTAFDERDIFVPRLANHRYLAFDGGIGPSQWVDFDRYGELDRNAHTFGCGFDEWLVKSPAVREPPYWQNPKPTKIIPEDEVVDRRRKNPPWSQDADDSSTGCQLADEAAYQSIWKTVRDRALAMGVI